MNAHDPGRLAVTETGRGTRVVAVHGFTQTSRCWGPFAHALARRHRLVAVDAPGHGESAGVRVPMAGAAGLIGAAGGVATYLGYSMGARMVLHLALQRPDLVRRLVLIGASPGIADPTERDARRRSDEELARSIERDGVPEFLRRWLANPLFATLAPEQAAIEERCRNTADGLAWSLRLNGTGAHQPLWDRLETLGMPVLLIVGERDAKFRGLGDQMAERIGPRAEVAVVAGAGHSAHLERPRQSASVVLEWLARTDASATETGRPMP